MTTLVLLLVVVSLLILLDVLAVRFGVDSRDGIGDDHARRISY